MDFIRLARVGDFDETRMRSYQILGKFVGIVKDPDGTFWATEIACKHNNADLTTGHFRGDEVVCPRHGWIYNIRTGECLNQNSTPLRRHALKVEGENLLVSMQPVPAEDTPEGEDSMPDIVFNPDGD